MFIIECIPFSKGLNKESLSYFGPKYLEPGSLVKVSIRNKIVNALVLESKDATQIKSEIKSASFQLKKISPTTDRVTSKPFLQKEFLEAIATAAEYFVTTQGAVLSHLIPSFILENPNIFPSLPETGKIENKNQVSILQAPDEERLTLYRSLIREEFAKKRSVFLCLPQNGDVRHSKDILERGIESFVCTFHNEMSKNELKKELKKVCQAQHPILIIATARWLFLPIKDLGTIVIDKENEDGWKTLSKPFMDLRIFAEILANKKNIRTVIGDSFLRTETLYRYKKGEIGEFENVKWRLPSETENNVVDLREPIKRNLIVKKEEKEFKVLSPALLNLIKESTEKCSNIFIFAARKGLSPITICRDCGEQVKCGNCLAPMILYKTNTPNGVGGVFKCHQCSEIRDAAELCQNCRSWKLAAFGSGIDRVAEEIKNNFPDIKLFELNKDAVETNSKALKVAESFYDNRGSILLGTEMAFSYLYKKVGNSAIASFDSLFSIPDFHIREKIFRLILQTKNIAKEKFLIQTRNPNDQTIEFAVSGNLIEFYKKEIEDRQVLGYPPFGIFIKITVRGTRNFTSREIESIKNIFENYNPAIFNSIHEKRGEQSAINLVIKIPKEKWVDPVLISMIKSLPSHFEVKIDPDNLL